MYLVLDRQVTTDDRLFEIAQQSVQWGVDVIQLRDKIGTAKEILRCFAEIVRATKRRVPLIMNDRVDLAVIAGADGVHLGQDDVEIKDARKIMGRKAVIGISCQTYEHAKRAQREGADYIGFGSVFKTLTKPERRPMDFILLAKVNQGIKIPVFAIGGINVQNIGLLKKINVRRFAVCRAICSAKNIKRTITELRA